MGEKQQIRFKRGKFDCFGVALVVVLFAEEDVVTDGVIHDPRHLAHVGDRAVDLYRGIADPIHLAQQAVDQRCLPAPVGAYQGDQFTLVYLEVDVLQVQFLVGRFFFLLLTVV